MASEPIKSSPHDPLSSDIKGGGLKLNNKPQSLDLGETTSGLPILLVTANVGSIFDDPHSLIPQWLTQVSQQIKAQNPAFVAIHCQEVSLLYFDNNNRSPDCYVTRHEGYEGYRNMCQTQARTGIKFRESASS